MEHLYEKTKTFQDLIDLNLLFINGKIDQTIYHLGCLDNETLPYIEELIKINQLGLLTVESQPGYLFHNKYRQRAYIKFFINKDNIYLKRIIKNNKLYYRITEYPYLKRNILYEYNISNLTITKESDTDNQYSVIPDYPTNEFEEYSEIINNNYYIIELVHNNYQTFNIFQYLLDLINSHPELIDKNVKRI